LLRRQRFSEATTYAVYYGKGSLTALTAFDIVIIEPSYYSKDDILAIQQKGTLVLGYVTAMELGEGHLEYNFLKEEDFLYQNGERILQQNYGTYLLNLCSTHWRSMVMKRVGELCVQKGMDGVFIDTIGDVEMDNLPEQSALINAAVNLVKEIRKWFPQMIIIQNNGLELLCLQTAPFLDAIIWENPPVDVKESAQWVYKINERLQLLIRTNSIRVFALYDRYEELQRKDVLAKQKFADLNHYPVYFSPTHYLSIR